MFGWLKNGWAEARGDVACKEADDAISRYRTYDRYGRYSMISAFDRFAADLEDKYGDRHELPVERRKSIAAELIKVAREAINTRGGGIGPEGTRYGGLGVGLLSLLYEVETLPGARAEQARKNILEWQKHASAENYPDTATDR